MNLTLLKSTGQLLCKMPPNFGLSDVSSQLDGSNAFLAWISHKWLCVLLRASLQGVYNANMSYYCEHLHLEHLVKVVP